VKKYLIGAVAGVVIATGAFYLFLRQPASAGPNGGDLVPLDGGTAYAELLTNAETGEAMVHTWDRDLKRSRPIPSEPLVLGSGEESVSLMPHPTHDDPPGSCSRFYGRADWLRGGGIRHGWLRHRGHGEGRQFGWGRCWDAGRSHGSMWGVMGGHHIMGEGHGQHGGPRGE
jgi:hypothetical protein